MIYGVKNEHEERFLLERWEIERHLHDREKGREYTKDQEFTRMCRAHTGRLVTTRDTAISQPMTSDFMDKMDEMKELLLSHHSPSASEKTDAMTEFEEDVREQRRLEKIIADKIREEIKLSGAPRQKFINRVHWDVMREYFKKMDKKRGRNLP
ncbi:MAG: hypothetical protein HOJ13_02875 [Nitrospina sp.]|jgi:hypothetical protein|nr:hypothetical protein [Nitrospina sp.]